MIIKQMKILIFVSEKKEFMHLKEIIAPIFSTVFQIIRISWKKIENNITDIFPINVIFLYTNNNYIINECGSTMITSDFDNITGESNDSSDQVTTTTSVITTATTGSSNSNNSNTEKTITTNSDNSNTVSQIKTDSPILILKIMVKKKN